MWLTSVLTLIGAERGPARPNRVRQRSRRRRPARPLCLEVLENRLAPAVALLVTDPGDAVALDGVVTLREAMQAANTNTTVNEAVHDGSGGTDSISFDTAGAFATPQTITLGGTELTITDSVTITGPGAANLTISGNDASRIFNVAGGPDESARITVSISDLTISHGRAISGGGVQNLKYSDLTLSRVTLSANFAFAGGGICNSDGFTGNEPTLTLTNCTLSRNSALNGGGIYSESGFAGFEPTLTLTNCTLSDNSAASRGGGIFIFISVVSFTDSTLSGNTASSDGGGILNQGLVTLTHSTLSGNTAGQGGGGILNEDKLTVAASTLSGNSASYDGGGISNRGGTVTVTSSTLSGNSAGFGGGGIFNVGTLTLSDSILSGNSATFRGGGGIYNLGGENTATVHNCTLSGNTASDGGGGIYNLNGTVILSGSSLSGNSAGACGGGIYNVRGTVTATSSTLSDNSAPFGGGIYNESGTLTLTNTTLSDNLAGEGGGIRAQTGTVTLTSCALTGNSAYFGGGIQIFLGDLTLTNCTLSGNSAALGGGIFSNYNFLTLTNCTLSGNNGLAGNGIYNPVGTMTLNNTIVANSGGRDVINGGMLTGSNNLIETGIGLGELTNTLIGIDPALGPLQDNGGLTLTHALLLGSPAIDAGSNALVPAGVTTDQRGSGFPRIFGGLVDIGAFEDQTNQPPTDIALSNSSVAENLPAGAVVGSFSTFDPDASDRFTYALVAGAGSTDNASFTSDASGNLTTAASFDFETRSSYSIRVQSTDRGGLSVEKVSSISVTNVNEVPALTVPGAQTAFEDVDQAISGLSVSDPDGGSLTVTLGVGHGTLTLETTTGLTVSGNGSGSVSLSGSIADLNAALATLVYRSDLNFGGDDTLSVAVSDGEFSASGSVAIHVKSAAEQSAELQAQVNALYAVGVLKKNQANTLLDELDLKGNNGDIGKVQSFLNDVAGLLNDGVLTQAQAEALLGPGNILLLSVTRR